MHYQIKTNFELKQTFSRFYCHMITTSMYTLPLNLE